MTCQEAVMRTENLIEYYKFKWEIHNFSKLYDGVKSEVFVPSSILNARFSLEILYRIRNEKPECVFLLHNHPRLFPKTFRVKSKLNFEPLPNITCLSLSSESAKIVDENIELAIVQHINPGNSYNPESFFTTLKCKDVFVVHCHFELSGYKITSSMIPLPVSTMKNSYKLLLDMKKLYSSKKFCDFTIQIGEKILLAHKSILAARSPVFESMIQSQFQESQVNCTNIPDVDYKVFDCFLNYLYSGDIDDKNIDTLCSLYALAEKYAVSDLQMECGNELASCISLANAISMAKLAFYHSDAALKEKAINFIAHHFSEMYSRPDWRDVVKECPELSADIVGRVAVVFGTPKSNTD